VRPKVQVSRPVYAAQPRRDLATLIDVPAFRLGQHALMAHQSRFRRQRRANVQVNLRAPEAVVEARGVNCSRPEIASGGAWRSPSVATPRKKNEKS
jgi:hypothetical protein